MLFAFISLLLGVAVVTAVVPPGSTITELTDANFAEFVKSKDFILVDFFSPTCSDSKALAPELDKAAILLGKRNVDLAKVDCLGKGKALCYHYKVKKWPTLKAFRYGVLTSDYDGIRQADAVAGYVNGAEDMIQNNAVDTATTAGVASAKAVPVVASPSIASVVTTAPAVVPAVAAAPAVAPAVSIAPAAAAPVAAGPAVAPAAAIVTTGNEFETQENAVEIPAAGVDARVVSTPEEVIPIASSPTDVTAPAARPAASAAAVTHFTPSAETINELECAKCRILTPAQRKLNPNCKSFRRECIPNLSKTAPYQQQFTVNTVNMVPGGAGKKKRSYGRYEGLRK